MTEPSAPPRRRLPDLFGVAWVIIAAGAVMAPALSHGWSLGPYDQLSQLGLSQHAGALPHNPQVFDLIREIIPWTTLSWTQVHSGLLPLWNPYSALGAPLAFNWQSATFSVPALLGYLVPVRFDFTVQVLVTLVIGGTGTYVLARVMRLGVLGAAMAATVFELSGSFIAVLGWPIAATVSWSGWLFACAILVVRGRRRRRDITLFAVVVALSIYAGQPDTLILVVAALAVFLVVILAYRAVRRGMESLGKPVLDVALATLAGLGLAAPLILPAAQLSTNSIRTEGRHRAFPSYDLLHVIFQTFNGTSLAGSKSFDGPGLGFVSTAAYVGAIAIALAIVGVGLRFRRSSVVAFAAVALSMGALVYFSPLVNLLNDFPSLGQVRWVRAIVVMAFALAVLAGVGLDAVARSRGSRAVWIWLGAAFGGVGLAVLLVWLFGRGHLYRAEAAIRNRSFWWPVVEVVLGLVAVVFLVVMSQWHRRHEPHRSRLLGDPGRTAAGFLLLSSTVVLVALGAPWWSSNTTYLAPTPAEVALQRAVGTSVVGFGISSCLDPPTLGIQADVNIVYGVHELDSYDPLTPKQLYTAWERATGRYPLPRGAGGIPAAEITMFCPVVRTVDSARQFGVGYVLEPANVKGPPGSIFDQKVGDEELYRIPGSSVATLTPLAAHGAVPAVDAPGTPLSVTYPDAASWKLATHATSPQVLRLRLTDVPGWHASIDGKPLLLARFNRVMLQATIPAGRHTIELHYWPDYFNTGLVVAGATVVGLVVGPVVIRRSRRRKR